MSNLYLAYSVSEETRMENGYNAALIVADDTTAAKVTAKAGKPNGSTTDSKLDLWAYSVVSASAGSLPNGQAVMWLDGVRGFGGSRAA